MHTGTIIRTCAPILYGWECDCGQRSALTYPTFADAERALDTHVNTHTHEDPYAERELVIGDHVESRASGIKGVVTSVRGHAGFRRIKVQFHHEDKPTDHPIKDLKLLARPTHEDAERVPNAIPDAHPRNDVQKDIPVDDNVPEDPKDVLPQTLNDALAHRTRKARWFLFNHEELISLNQALVVAGSQVLGNSVLLRETQDEMRRRKIPLGYPGSVHS